MRQDSTLYSRIPSQIDHSPNRHRSTEEHFPSLLRFDWRTISVSACEGGMLHEGEEGLSGKLVRVKGESFEGVGLL